MEEGGNGNKRRRGPHKQETPEEKRVRLDKHNEQRRLKRQNETDGERQIRLEKARECDRISRQLETPGNKRARLNKQVERNRISIQKETAEEGNERRERDAERQRVSVGNETPAGRMKRLINMAALHRLHANESAEEKRNRLVRNNETATIRSNCRSVSFRNIASSAENDEISIPENYLGELNNKCIQCSSLNFSGEMTAGNKTEFTRCCQKGQVKLEPLQQYPEYFKNLLTKRLPESTHFLEFIRCYNSSFAFASVGAKQDPKLNAPGMRSGPYCFRVCGQISHRSGTLHPGEHDVRKYSQIYILDPNDAKYQRLSLPENAKCKELLMQNIGEIMDFNPFARSVKMLQEVEKESAAEAEKQGIPPTEVMLAILHDRSKDQRRYNAQAVNEVAVVFQSKDGEPPFERDIIMHLRPISNEKKDQTKRINILNPNLDALTYPLLFPNGDRGWHIDIQRFKAIPPFANNEAEDSIEEEIVVKSRKTVSMREYFSYRLSVRAEFNPLLSARKLTHQYIVDAYVRAEANDLNYIRTHQSLLRAEKYSNLMDHINSDAGNVDKAGTRIILPSSFQGSPRNMHQHYQDAMAIVTKYGKPDIFVTMTCNPKWKEIVENLEPEQRPEDRPDLVARVFNLKLKELLEDIRSKDRSLFGEVIAMIHVIEFQKRGLPHAHILIILSNNHKLKTVDDIDRIVKAKIPDKDKCPRLYTVVTKNMIHTPCGERGPNSPCMVDKKCSKGFPKTFQDKTLGNIDGYPIYRRREGITATDARGNSVDNSWVVPYNPFLSLKYDCHINVEICASVKSVKYLFKYVYKGHDCANIEVKESNIPNPKNPDMPKDESKEYVDSRYVSAPEAIWRIFSFRMHEQSHTIYRLPVHLENEQTICFNEGSEQTAVERAGVRNTKLTAWFELNRTDSNAREYRYWEIPSHYTWDNKNTKWNTRKRGGEKVIGRMYTVSLKDQERYFLRLLLSHEKGATSFNDLLTIRKNDETTVVSSFREAAKGKGYLLDETIWQSTMDDAKTYEMPYQLRQLFAYICVMNPVSDKLKLWNDNKEHMIEDFCFKIHRRQGNCRNCDAYALKDICSGNLAVVSMRVVGFFSTKSQWT